LVNGAACIHVPWFFFMVHLSQSPGDCRAAWFDAADRERGEPMRKSSPTDRTGSI